MQEKRTMPMEIKSRDNAGRYLSGVIINGMPVSFDRLGPLFKLFSVRLYPRAAKSTLFGFIAAVDPARPVMDLGGGTGALFDLAYSKRPDVTYLCADPAIGMLRYVGRHALRVAARAENLPFRDGVLGAVMIGDAIHHFANAARAVEEARRVLKPGGKLLVIDMDPTTLMGRMVAALEGIVREPARFYAPDALCDLLARNGFAASIKKNGLLYAVEAEKERGPIETGG
jgi:demethylmenaquinone methyltransferase/2-methoxy-6-polyprenyl-1,4-benzoquinol methylase